MNRDEKIAYAKRLLVGYFRSAHAPTRWDGDNTAEVESIVDLIVEAASMPVPTTDVRMCSTCAFVDYSGREEPCLGCRDYAKWVRK
jgi:hypothetical protein